MFEFNNTLDPDGQPVNLAFNKNRNKNKAASCLMGILNGITADQELKDVEVSFLQNWLDNQEEYKGDILDIYEAVQSILEDHVITQEEKNDLFCLLNDCIEYGPNIFENDLFINQFIGFLKGITADDNINEMEFNKLRIELKKYDSIISKWPYDIIGKSISNFLEDGIVDSMELKELCETIQDITGTKFTKYGDAVGGATTLYAEPVTNFINKKVCLTGKFINGSRSDIKKQIEKMGAITKDNVSEQVDILIIGTLCSKDWIHTSTGRKIEKAIELRNKGHLIAITNEEAIFQKSNQIIPK